METNLELKVGIMAAYKMNTEYFSEQEYDNWEEYISDDDEEYQVEQVPIAAKKPETPEQRAAQEEKLKHELAMISDKLNWVNQKKEEIVTNLDTEEFPCLGKTSEKKERPQFKPIHPKGSKVSNKKFVVTGMSYAEESREKVKKEIEDDNKRTVAFEALADKETLEKKLVKTKMCNSVTKMETCPHGENCRFAHSLSELNVSNCLFEHQCRFVRSYNGKVSNVGRKTCEHKHPDESVEEFYKRTGLDKYREKPKIEEKSRLEPLVLDLAKMQKAKEEYQRDRAEGINWAAKLAPRPEVPKPASIEETVLRVPKELALQAMELAIKSGKKAIRVEII